MALEKPTEQQQVCVRIIIWGSKNWYSSWNNLAIFQNAGT